MLIRECEGNKGKFTQNTKQKMIYNILLDLYFIINYFTFYFNIPGLVIAPHDTAEISDLFISELFIIINISSITFFFLITI